jgi:hypothetical protein
MPKHAFAALILIHRAPRDGDLAQKSLAEMIWKIICDVITLVSHFLGISSLHCGRPPVALMT